MPFVDSAREACGVGDEEIVADQHEFFSWMICCRCFASGFPAGPVVLRHAVFDGDEMDIFSTQAAQ